MIEIIPATDIIGGQCVRLTQGDYASRKTYYRDPLEAAFRFEEAGIRRLHMVDLDGAKASEPRNLAVLERIAARTSLEVQYGGGIKSREALHSVFDAGARRAICGSVAVRRPDLFATWLAEFDPGRLGRRPQRRGGHRGLAGKFDALGPRADRAIHSAGAYAGYLHRHLPRRHALRPLGSLLRRPARPLPDGGDHRQRRHLFDVGHRRVRPAGAGELVYLDISASEEGRRTFTELVARIAARIDIPFTVGGGISSVDDASRLLDAGADKITLNSAAVANPALIDAIAARYGSQFVVAAIDARMTDGVWRPCDTFARLAELPVPIIASGGAGTADHIADVLTLGRADAALAASIFHYNEIPILVLKRELKKRNINVRL